MGYSKGKTANKASSRSSMDMEPDMSFRSIRKEIDFLTSSHMSWKDKKEIENRKIVSLGGKLQKKQRLPLSVARPIMKKQKEREQKMLQERLSFGQFGGITSRNVRRDMGKRKPEDQVLKSSEGFFRNGVLDVRRLLHPAPHHTRKSDTGNEMVKSGKRKGGKKNQSKKKGGGKKRH